MATTEGIFKTVREITELQSMIGRLGQLDLAAILGHVRALAADDPGNVDLPATIRIVELALVFVAGVTSVGRSLVETDRDDGDARH